MIKLSKEENKAILDVEAMLETEIAPKPSVKSGDFILIYKLYKKTIEQIVRLDAEIEELKKI